MNASPQHLIMRCLLACLLFGSVRFGSQYHKLIYAEDVLILNSANRDHSPITISSISSSSSQGTTARLYGVAKPASMPEIGRLETSREAIFNGMRDGFAAAYDGLVLDPALRV